MHRITGEEILVAMEKAVAQRGDGWQYPDPSRCQYVYEPDIDKYDDYGTLTPLGEEFGDEEQPACLVGLAIDILDHSLLNAALGQNMNHTSVSGLALEGCWPLTESAVAVAQAAQECQDDGGTWGEALVLAKEALAIHRSGEK